LNNKSGLSVFGWTDEQIEESLAGFEHNKMDCIKVLSGSDTVEAEDFVRFADMVEAANL
jgi:hypothetical protein